MIINDVINKVTAERHTRGRFPARFIFARNFADYNMLVDELRSVCDVTIDLAEFTKGDILPRFKELKLELKKYPDKQILLLSIGEYLRLCIKRETNKETAEIPGIWETIQPEHATTKYIIPIFGGREHFDQVVPLIDERQKDFIWELSGNYIESEYNITIYAPLFADALQTDATNLQEWLENWSALFKDKERDRFSLTTKLLRYSEESYGSIKVEIVKDAFTYVTSLVTDGNILRKNFGDDEFWAEVAKEVKRGLPFSATIKYMLNIGHNFDPISILALYEQATDTERRLLWIWYKLFPKDDYYTYAFGKAISPEDIPMVLRDAIFTLPRISARYIEERNRALNVLNLQYDDNYFAKLDSITSPEMRLSLLTYKKIEERAYAIKTVSGLLRTGADTSAIAAMINSGYPELSEYLAENGSDVIAQYFNWYRKSKLINRPTTDIPCMIDFDDIDSRNKVLQQSGESHQFWVDGLGVEWMPLLISRLNKLSVPVNVTSKVAKAILPTETEFNHKWKSNDDKWDRLDKLSHNGLPDDKDYFLCIVRQIEIIVEVIAHVSTLLEKHDRVIITSDHGSSRLAALMFHSSDNYAIQPPAGAHVRSFGRFCELAGNSNVLFTSSMECVSEDNRSYIVMKTYEHFRSSGNAAGGNTDDISVAGEVHGGMTPEEYLVPVIVVSRKSPHPTLTKRIKPKVAAVNELGI